MSQGAVALLSGGLDSGVGLALWLETADHRVVECLTFDYGQRSARAEAEAAGRLARRFDLPWRCIDLPWLGAAATRAGSALVPGGGGLPRRSGAETAGDPTTAEAVWVPARNLVFLSIGASVAEAAGGGWVLAGFNREEAETFSDNSAPFVAAVDQALRFATRTRVQVCSPTLTMDKVAVVAAARRHGLTQTDFWSCYDGGDQPCGSCESCVRSDRAWGAAEQI